MELFSTRCRQVSDPTVRPLNVYDVSFHFDILAFLLLHYLISCTRFSSLYHFYHLSISSIRSILYTCFLIFCYIQFRKILNRFFPPPRLLSRELRQGELEIVKRLLELEQLYQIEPHNASSVDRRCFKFGAR